MLHETLLPPPFRIFLLNPNFDLRTIKFMLKVVKKGVGFLRITFPLNKIVMKVEIKKSLKKRGNVSRHYRLEF